MEGNKGGYAWAISAGLNAALAAISAKLFSSQASSLFFNACFYLIFPSMLHLLFPNVPGLATFFAMVVLLRELIKYGLVIFFNVVMWGCYVNSLKALSSLQATVTNFATNFLSSGLAGFFLFEEALSFQWFAGALLIVIGVLVLSKSSMEGKTHPD